MLQFLLAYITMSIISLCIVIYGRNHEEFKPAMDVLSFRVADTWFEYFIFCILIPIMLPLMPLLFLGGFIWSFAIVSRKLVYKLIDILRNSR